MENNKLDLNELAAKQDLTVNIASREDPAERDSRLRREEADAAHSRRKDFALHVVTFFVIAVTFTVCAYLILAAPGNTEQNKWATATLTSIVTGLVGYVTGKSQK